MAKAKDPRDHYLVRMKREEAERRERNRQAAKQKAARLAKGVGELGDHDKAAARGLSLERWWKGKSK